jgi:tetratricopeptide (TPR) repeat protein
MRLPGALFLAMFIVLLPLARLCAQGAFDVAEIVKRAKPWVVTIVTYDGSGKPLMQGSGFFIASGDLVTCRHVLRGAARASFHDPNNNQMEITGIVANNEDADLVKVRTMMVREGRGMGIPLGNSLPEEGEEVVIIGSPKGLEFTTSEGIVSALRKDEHVSTAIQVTAATSQGSSGSPVLNMRGEVIGIVESKYGSAENVTFVTPVSCLSAMHDETPTPLSVWSEGQGMAEPGAGTNSDEEGEIGTMKRMSKESSSQAKEYFEQKDYNKAMGLYTEAIMEYASNADAWLGAGLCYETTGDFAHAREALQNASELSPHSFDPLYQLGKSLYFTGYYEEASKYTLASLLLEPDDGSAWNDLARCYEAMDKDTLAIQAVDSAMKYATDVTESHAVLGEAYLHLRRFPAAEAEFDTAIKSERRPEYLVAQAEVYSYTERKERGRKLLLESLRTLIHQGSQHPDPNMLARLGGDLSHLGSYQEAMMTYRIGLMVDPENAVLHHDLGACFIHTDQPELAIAEYKESVRDDPTLIPAHVDLAMAELEFHHDRPAALVEYKALEKLDPKIAGQLLDKIGK